MKFLYEYRTRDNVRHEGEICATDREAAFAALKSQGVKPSRLVDAPGFFNRLLGHGKRWLAIAALALAFLAALVAKVGSDRRAARTMQVAQSAIDVLDSPVRRQLVGDLAVIGLGVQTGWADVFAEKGVRLLARYAIPGVPVASDPSDADSLRSALSVEVTASPDDGIEARQLKAIVRGMQGELRAYLDAGGDLRGYARRLALRQRDELAVLARLRSEFTQLQRQRLTPSELLSEWRSRNAELRQLGLPLIEYPTPRK